MLEEARVLSQSQMIPKAYQGRPQDILIALQMAQSLGVSGIEVLNGMSVVQGRPSFSAQFAISLAHRKKAFASAITFESQGAGDSLEVTASAQTHCGKKASSTVSMQMAHREGWTRNPKYQSMPEHMLRYRAATFLIRLHCPHILLGEQTVEEIKDLQTPIQELESKIQNLRMVEPKP